VKERIQDEASAPAEPGRDAAGAIGDGGLDSPESVPRAVWERVKAEPERAPEIIALSVAEQIAPVAERWVALQAGSRDPRSLAELARKKHVRMSRLEGAVAGLGGVFTVVPDLAALAWIQGRMAIFMAAAYGFDPHHPMRPAEILALQQLYPSAKEAREGLDGVGRPMALQYVDNRLARDEAVMAALLKLAGRKLGKRAALKVVPLLSSPLSAVQNSRRTAALGHRAHAYYGG
jgi:hypothetical protein